MRKNRKQRNCVGSKQLAPPNYLIISEGKQTEPNYFQGLKNEINEKYKGKVKLVPALEIHGKGMNTESLVEHVRKFVNHAPVKYGHVWIIFDKDLYLDEQFDNAIKMARDLGYSVAWSNPNFELYILSHFKEVDREVTKDETQKLVEIEFQNANIGIYEKKDKDIFLKLNKDSRIKNAIENSRKMLERFECVNCSKKNPANTVFLLLEELKEYLED